MSLNKITYDTKVALNPQPSVADVNKVSDDDMNEIKTVVNDAIDQVDTNSSNITDMNTTELETATLNPTYFSTIDYNSCVRVGKVVFLNFRALFKANTSGTVTLITLPFNCKVDTEVNAFIGDRYNPTAPFFAYIGSSKYIYTGTNTNINGKWLHLTMTYIMP